jgi:hypothetical protein
MSPSPIVPHNSLQKTKIMNPHVSSPHFFFSRRRQAGRGFPFAPSPGRGSTRHRRFLPAGRCSPASKGHARTKAGREQEAHQQHLPTNSSTTMPYQVLAHKHRQRAVGLFAGHADYTADAACLNHQ